MSQVDFHNQSNDWKAWLNANINGVVTSLVLRSSGASGCPDVPFLFSINAEIIRCSLVQTDTPSEGLDTLTITRGHGDSIAAPHTTTDLARGNIYEANFTELQDRCAALERALLYNLGGNPDGVIRIHPDDGHKVEPTDPASMTVTVGVGAQFVASQLVSLAAAATSAAMVAPGAGLERIDVIQIDQDGDVSVVTGTPAGSNPETPSADANNAALASITMDENTTTITVSEITDLREFA